MHENKHMHRDLKLDNILLHFSSNYERDNFVEYEKTGFQGMQIKIADLGYAKNIEGTDLASTLCGTPITMPPEVVQNHLERNLDRGYNAKADLWSLGALTYEMLVSQPPFNGYNIDDLFKNISKGVYNYPQNCMISIEAISFINGLLTFSNYERFSFNDMKTHPFLVKDPSTFHPIDLNIVPKDSMIGNKIEIDSKNCNNFLWIMFKNNGLKNLDQLNVNDLNDEKIMESICIINQNILSDKRDMLSLFRKGAKKQKGNSNKLSNSNEKAKEKEFEVNAENEVEVKANAENVVKNDSILVNEIKCNIDNLYNISSDEILEEVKESKEDKEDNENKENNNLVEAEENDYDDIEEQNDYEKDYNLSRQAERSDNRENIEQQKQDNEICKIKQDLLPKNDLENDLVCKNIENENENTENLDEKQLDCQKISIWKDSSYIHCDRKAKIEEDEVWEILSSYSMIDKDGDWPLGFEVQVETYSDYQLVQEHFLSKAN
jgi:serine/threonine protein kinase